MKNTNHKISLVFILCLFVNLSLFANTGAFGIELGWTLNKLDNLNIAYSYLKNDRNYDFEIYTVDAPKKIDVFETYTIDVINNEIVGLRATGRSRSGTPYGKEIPDILNKKYDFLFHNNDYRNRYWEEYFTFTSKTVMEDGLFEHAYTDSEGNIICIKNIRPSDVPLFSGRFRIFGTKLLQLIRDMEASTKNKYEDVF